MVVVAAAAAAAAAVVVVYLSTGAENKFSDVSNSIVPTTAANGAIFRLARLFINPLFAFGSLAEQDNVPHPSPFSLSLSLSLSLSHTHTSSL